MGAFRAFRAILVSGHPERRGARFLDNRAEARPRGGPSPRSASPTAPAGVMDQDARFTPIRSPVSSPSPWQVSPQDRTEEGQSASSTGMANRPWTRSPSTLGRHAREEGRAHGPVPQPVRARASTPKVHDENATESPLGSGEGPGIEGAHRPRWCTRQARPRRGAKVNRPVSTYEVTSPLFEIQSQIHASPVTTELGAPRVIYHLRTRNLVRYRIPVGVGARTPQ
jgi:hypothetical protein